MSLTTQLKALWRSRSLDFALHSSPSRPTDEIRTLRYRGRLIHYRPGGSDVENIAKKLLKRDSEYWLPPHFQPRTILDLGANIGTASIDFALRYPKASITAIEPVSANFRLLEKNIASFPNIRAFQFAVGREDLSAAVRGAGQSLHAQPWSEEAARAKRERVTVRAIDSLVSELGLPQIDLIKIDVEGAEYDVLTTLPQKLLEQVQWIVGELHGIRDFALLDYLSTWFEIDGRKTITKECWKFHAVNRTHAKRLLHGFDLKILQR